VLVDGVENTEVVPDRRRRDALSLRYKRALGQDSYELGSSYYWDSWGIKALTLDAHYYYAVREDALLVPRYRYYTQDEADFFAPGFNSGAINRSIDSDLGDFDGHLFGVLYKIFNVHTADIENVTYDIGFNYYRRSDDLHLFWLAVGVAHPL